MIRRALSRAAALFAAFMLSGVPAVAAQIAAPSAPACCCPGGGHGRQCPMKKPGAKTPCHGSPGSPGDDCPTLAGPCGVPFAQTTPPPRADEFTLLQWPPLQRPPTVSFEVEVAALSGDVPPLPETPPPKRA